MIRVELSAAEIAVIVRCLKGYGGANEHTLARRLDQRTADAERQRRSGDRA